MVTLVEDKLEDSGYERFTYYHCKNRLVVLPAAIAIQTSSDGQHFRKTNNLLIFYSVLASCEIKNCARGAGARLQEIICSEVCSRGS